jgi:hypothetical protein
MNAKIHFFDTTVAAYAATQSDDQVREGDVLIIESEKIVGLASTWPVAVTELSGELHHLEGAWPLAKLGFSKKSIDLARDAAKSHGWPLFVPELEDSDTLPSVSTLGSLDAAECLANVIQARDEAEVKAWDSLARYKFEMFGYWASSWVKFNQALPKLLRAGNPFKRAVVLARSVRDEQG